ncbi:MAG: hypothetical protein A3J93_03625 [Candidatus Magasanikbacteria bacterium RIFOXYC2_FULL_42_28]|uniref:Ligand-binding protein SH3 n=1 Tax=Candidatus Magasanikbacteria bacterium RIFOXYC2_FULL_42_28 TaxID=1798704 RepID=A0A1F6NUJ4_9BACT|nr:MAG: hypothetical protein A3J93_03625 [Candidatus Magasanikbacteria bacterium RIFOXYC2_FULL_42_28]
MINYLVGLFSSWPPELATFFLAMLPVGELRLAIPVAIFGLHLSKWSAYFWSVLGNLVPALLILYFAKYFHNWVDKKSGFFGKRWINALDRAHKKFEGDYLKYRLVGLLIFIGVPLPLTGAWTGCLAAFVFGIPFKKAWPFVVGGVLLSGVLTLLLTVGADKIF